MSTHPDFEAADSARQWTKSLPELAELFAMRIYGAKGEWVWFMLPRGALVAMRVDPATWKKELRIARREPPKEGHLDKWIQEIRVFQKELGLAEWVTVELVGRPAPGQPAYAILREPEPLGIKPKEEPRRCAECGDPVPPEQGHYKAPRCVKCAIKAGDAETAELRRQREATDAPR